MAVFAFGADDTKEILQMIKILENATNSTYKEVSGIYNPFVKKSKVDLIHKKRVVHSVTISDNSKYNLEIVFQNRVRINNNWYNDGDKLDNYTIIIKNNKVYLKNKNKKILLNRKSILKVR